jgi:hypothetical protein
MILYGHQLMASGDLMMPSKLIRGEGGGGLSLESRNGAKGVARSHSIYIGAWRQTLLRAQTPEWEKTSRAALT